MSLNTLDEFAAKTKVAEQKILKAVEHGEIIFDLSRIVRYYAWNGLQCRTIGDDEAEQFLIGRGWVHTDYTELKENGERLTAVKAAYRIIDDFKNTVNYRTLIPVSLFL